MGYAAYPVAADLTAFLADAGFSNPHQWNNALAVESAKKLFERRVSRTMLATSGTRTFNPPINRQGFVDFKDDLATLTSVSISGTAQTLNTDFVMEPDGNPDRGMPWHGLRFPYKVWYKPLAASQIKSVSVVGYWGFATTIPEDAWLAIIQMAAAGLGPSIQQSISGGLTMWQHGDVSERYGEAGQLNAYLTGLMRAADDVVAAYKRVIV